MTETDFVLKIKNASQNISANFLVKGTFSWDWFLDYHFKW
jgi:hypothetical protein